MSIRLQCRVHLTRDDQSLSFGFDIFFGNCSNSVTEGAHVSDKFSVFHHDRFHVENVGEVGHIELLQVITADQVVAVHA